MTPERVPQRLVDTVLYYTEAGQLTQAQVRDFLAPVLTLFADELADAVKALAFSVERNGRPDQSMLRFGRTLLRAAAVKLLLRAQGVNQ